MRSKSFRCVLLLLTALATIAGGCELGPSDRDPLDPDREDRRTDGSSVIGDGNVISNGDNNAESNGADEVTEGDGNFREHARAASDIAHVVNDSALSVQVRQGAPSIVVRMDANLHAFIATTIDGDTLTVRLTRAIRAESDGPHVVVTMPQPRSVVAARTGSLDVATNAPAVPFSIETRATGSVTFSGEASTLTAISERTGSIRLAGSAQRVELVAEGTGSIDAAALIAQSGRIETSSVGSVTAQIRGTVDVASSGTGSVRVTGGATPGEVTEEGLGRVVIR